MGIMLRRCVDVGGPTIVIAMIYNQGLSAEPNWDGDGWSPASDYAQQNCRPALTAGSCNRGFELRGAGHLSPACRNNNCAAG